MEKQEVPKVVVDTAISEKIPTVVVSSPLPAAKIPKASENIILTTSKRLVNFVLDFLESIVVALSIFVVIYLFIMQPHEIKGNSMEPSFKNNEYILTDKVSYRLKDPQRGDVVIFKSPKNPDIDYIKRIIGLPGERIKIQNGAVYINDEILKEEYLNSGTFLFPGSFMQEGIEISIPDGKYFVMGDNRSHSSDSREFGPISPERIIGRAFWRYWPIISFGLLREVNYQEISL